jgi:hypothetical protein
MLTANQNRVTETEQNSARIADDLASACALRTRQNTLTGLASLPLDVLRLIFIILSKLSYRQIEWLNLMGTYTRLRMLAVNTPVLWSYIDLERQILWIDLCLQRVRSYPLSVSCYTRDSVDASGAEVLAGLARNAQEFNVSFSEYTTRTALIPLETTLNNPLPSLRNLTYKTSEETVFKLSKDFAGGTPVSNLTRLILRPVNISRDSPFFPSLIYLDLDGVSVNKPEHLMGFLTRTPRIEHLVICRITAFDISDNPSTENVSLQHLTTAKLEVTLKWISVLMRVLPFPLRECQLSVEPDEDTEGAEAGPVKDALRVQTWNEVSKLLQPSSPYPGPTLSWDEDSYWTLQRCSEVDRPSIIYEDRCFDLPQFDCILSSLTDIRIAVMMQEVFEHVTGSAIDPLSGVKHLTIEAGVAGYEELREWLQARVEAGTRLQLIDFEAGFGCFREPEFHSVADIAYDLMQQKLVGAVLEDGNVPAPKYRPPPPQRQSTPIRFRMFRE